MLSCSPAGCVERGCYEKVKEEKIMPKIEWYNSKDKESSFYFQFPFIEEKCTAILQLEWDGGVNSESHGYNGYTCS